MRKILILNLLIILLTSCNTEYKSQEIFIDGKLKKVLLPVNYLAKVKGIRPFEEQPKGKYDGLLFVVEPDTAFTTKGVKNYLLICSLDKEKTGYRTINCKCLEPNIDKYYPNSTYVYEELFKDKNCRKKIKL